MNVPPLFMSISLMSNQTKNTTLKIHNNLLRFKMEGLQNCECYQVGSNKELLLLSESVDRLYRFGEEEKRLIVYAMAAVAKKGNTDFESGLAWV